VFSKVDRETPGLGPDIDIEFQNELLTLLKYTLIWLMPHPLESEHETVNVLLEERRLPDEIL
jgi:hypothetical protein